MYEVISKDELYHHGILGQKWGVRRFQNPDGSLTNAGRERYNTFERDAASIQLESRSAASRYSNKIQRRNAKLDNRSFRNEKQEARVRSRIDRRNKRTEKNIAREEASIKEIDSILKKYRTLSAQDQTILNGQYIAIKFTKSLEMDRDFAQLAAFDSVSEKVNSMYENKQYLDQLLKK